jgi:hypothetical protein
MVPGNKFDKPAKSPFMDMMLVPMYADADGDASKVTVSSRIQQNLGLRTAEVSEGTLAPGIDAVGNIAFNERDQVIVQARATGFVEKLFVRATLDTVTQGQPLAELYVPDWIAAQEEFLSVSRMKGSELAPLVDAARQRMRQVGMSDAQIAAVEERGQVQPRFTVHAPIGGVVSELGTADAKADLRVHIIVDHDALKRGDVFEGETCEIQGVGPVSVEWVRSILGEAFLTAIIKKGTDITTVAHFGRNVPELVQTAKIAGGHECEAEDCEIHGYLERDHVHDFALGGVTSLANLIWLCYFHHRLKSRGWILGPPDPITGKRKLFPPNSQVA